MTGSSMKNLGLTEEEIADHREDLDSFKGINDLWDMTGAMNICASAQDF